MNVEAKPWYLSKTILVLIAGVILALLGKLGWLPADLTQDKVVSFLTVAIPMLLAAWTRYTSKTVVVGSQKAADQINTTL